MCFRFLRSVSAVAALAVCSLSPALAQEAPKAEVFAGYSYLHFDDFGVDELDGHGFHLSAAGNVNRWFGLEGELSGHYDGEKSVHYLMGGPRFSYRGERATVFAHALAGGVFLDTFSSGTDIGMAFGGGVDVRVNDRVSIRAIQVDYTPSIFLDGVQHNVRASTGVVFSFGR